jgi:hypothetical protein
MSYTGAVTLTQFAQMSNPPLVQAATFSLIENGNVMMDIPFMNAPQMTVNGVRFEGNLPTVNWSNINGEPTPTSGTPTPFQEQAYLIRNTINMDKVLVMDRTQIQEPRGVQVSAYLKGVTYDFNDKFINNNHTSGDKKSFVGLRERIDNGSTYGVRSENKLNGGAVDLTTAAATNATFGNFLELVDELLFDVDAEDGTGVVLYMNEVMRRRWDSLARRFSGAGGFSTAQDQLGRGITRYKNAVVRTIGRKADQSTQIITSTETSAGVNGASTHTSIYAVHYGMAHLYGWQYAPLNVQDLGLDNGGVLYKTLIDWTGGLFSPHTRSIARLYGIKLA